MSPAARGGSGESPGLAGGTSPGSRRKAVTSERYLRVFCEFCCLHLSRPFRFPSGRLYLEEPGPRAALGKIKLDFQKQSFESLKHFSGLEKLQIHLATGRRQVFVNDTFRKRPRGALCVKALFRLCIKSSERKVQCRALAVSSSWYIKNLQLFFWLNERDGI